jgi:ATP-binding cassette subfamily C protein CydCD
MYFDRRLFSFTAGLRWRIVLASIVGLIAIPVAIWRLTLTGATMAKLFQGASLSDVASAIALIVSLVLIRAVLILVKEEIAHGTASRMKVKVRRMLYEHVLRLGPGHFDQKRTGDATLSLVEGVETMETFYGLYLPQLVISSLTPIIIFAFMAFLDLRTALVFLVFAFFALISPALFHRMNRDSSMARRRAYAALGSDFLDSMQGLPTLKVFGQSGKRGDMLAQRARDVYRSTMWVLATNIATGGIALFGISAGAATALVWGAIRVQDGGLDLRTLLIVLLLGVEVFRPLRDMVVLYHQGMMATASARGIFDILDTPPDIADAVGSATDVNLQPSIRFEDVTFGYLAGRRPALHDLSFELRPGETLGVVGPSGAGKSTIINLLLRFGEPQQGRVFVGGIDVREIPLAELRRHVAVVTQDTYLFHGTIADNLRIGKPGASQAEMEAAATSANIHAFIASLPAGYNTIVGERGARLSGGQRQRIAIARALLKDAEILVLDEALSSVDAENENEIQQALDRLQAGRTTLVIAHRLSSVANAHRIIVLDRGELVESGTNDELQRAGGIYSTLMASQFALQSDSDDAAARGMAAVVVANGTAAHNGHQHEHSDAGGHDHNGHNHDDQHNGHSHDGNGNGRVAAEALPMLPVVEREIPMSELSVRLLRLIGPWKWEMGACLLAGIANSVSTVLLGALGALAVGRVATGGDATPFLIGLLLMVPLSAVFAWLDGWIAHDMAFRLLAEMRGALYRLLDRLAPAYLLRRRTGDLVSAATGDIELIELFYAHTISPAFQAVLVPGGVLIALALIAPPLALVLAPFLVLVALTPLFAGKIMEKIGGDLRRHQGEMNAHMVDSVQGLRTIVAFGHESARSLEVDANGEKLGVLKQRFMRYQGRQNAVIESLTALGGLAVLVAGAELISNGNMARTDLPLATLLAVASFAPVFSLVPVAKELMQTVAASRRYFAVEDEVPTVADGSEDASHRSTREIVGVPFAFEDVTFRYTAEQTPALDHVTLRAAAGETVAVVGRSGAGKSTAAHLLLRFWDPQGGRVTLDGRDIRDFKLDELRSQIALVAQDTYLFNTSLWENLKLGRPEATDDEVTQAARLANVEEFATALPEGYETVVGERGTQLSGGQRQRVAIARALLKDAPILILDEATSHLDAVNEAQVREALDHLMAGRTTLIIAHRLSTIRNAGKIVVLDDGRVAEQGTHHELLALDGLYSHLISHQLLARREDDEVAAAISGTKPEEAAAHSHAHGHSHG